MKKQRIIQQEVKLEYSCDGPFIFPWDEAWRNAGIKNRVCCHGWNNPHFLTSVDVNRTQQLINAGVITHPSEPHIQQVEKVEEQTED